MRLLKVVFLKIVRYTIHSSRNISRCYLPTALRLKCKDERMFHFFVGIKRDGLEC